MSTRLIPSVLLLSLLVTGCGLFGGPPAGYQEASTGTLSFVYPSGWQRVSGGSEEGGGEFAVRLRQESRTVAKITVLEGLGKSGDAVLVAATGRAGPQLSWRGYHVEDQRVIEVEGSRDARRVTFTYKVARHDPGTRSAFAPARGVDIALVGTQNEGTIVRITWREGELEDQVVESIVSSIEVSGS